MSLDKNKVNINSEARRFIAMGRTKKNAIEIAWSDYNSTNMPIEYRRPEIAEKISKRISRILD